MNEQINSLKHFQEHSRLHFIGRWKTKMQDVIKEWLQVHPEWRHISSRKQRLFIHIDMDAFFCSVQLVKPENAHLREMPVAISAGKYNSDISSCNYCARKCGVSAGMYVSDARKLCPDLHVLGYDLKAAENVSLRLYQIIFQSCPSGLSLPLEVYSIDEVMVALDTEDYELAREFCDNIRRTLQGVTGCTASCGVGPNIMLARLATGRAKPDGVKVFSPEKVSLEMPKILFKEVHGVGPSTLAKMHNLICETAAKGVFCTRQDASLSVELPSEEEITCRDVQRFSILELQQVFGQKGGETFYNLCRGIDDRQVRPTGVDDEESTQRKGLPSSVGCTMNYAVRPTCIGDIWSITQELLSDVAEKLKRHSTQCRGLRVTLLERHPLYPKEPRKYMGRGACLEVHIPIRFSKSLGGDQSEEMMSAIKRELSPLFVTSRLLGDTERAAQLGVATDMEGTWTWTLSELTDIVISDLRGMSIQATGLEHLRAHPSRTKRSLEDGQITLDRAFQNIGRRHLEEEVTVQSDTTQGNSSGNLRSSHYENSDSEIPLFDIFLEKWEEGPIEKWHEGFQRAIHNLNYPAIKAFLRCALYKTGGDIQMVSDLLASVQDRLPFPVEFL